MNECKVCFIYCANDETLLQESLKYLTQLEIPSGFEIEVIAVRDAKSMTAGYNYAMKQTDAKYKVYLHQDTYIINRSFISDVVDMFQKHPQIGLLGMVGAASIPLNAVWWESEGKYGKVFESHTGKMDVLEFQLIHSDYEKVYAIDGFLMITQYDIPWREDLFKGWHFYDLSQSMEFMKAGYEVGVPRQDKPWSLHDCGIVDVRNGFEEYRKVFLSEYSGLLNLNSGVMQPSQGRTLSSVSGNAHTPKVSILVPAYRPEYLDICIASALNQTFDDFELLVSDDSAGDAVESVISKWQDRRIKYFKNPNRQKPGANRDYLISKASGKYIKFLFDDDYLLPQSLEYLVSAAEQFDAKLAFHGRHFVDHAGRVLASPLFVKSGTVLLLTSEQYFENMISNCVNIIGEPSNVLIDTATLRSIPNPFGMDDIRMRFLTDVSLYTNIAHRGLKITGIGYLGSAFRQHGTQTSRASNPIFSAGLFEWESFSRWSIDRGHLSFQQYQRAINKCMDKYRPWTRDYPELNWFIELAGAGENGRYYNEKYRELISLAYSVIETNKMKIKS